MMEVDGRKLKYSLYQGSDEDHDFPCSPCAKEGKNIDGIQYCVECDENLCKTCLNHHNKFSSMKAHQLLNKVKTPSGKSLELPSQRCERHGGKLIDVYCQGHDKVGCSTCMTTEHSGCQEIRFIPDIASKTETCVKLRLLETDIKKLHSRFLDLKEKKNKYLGTIRQEKYKLLQEIKSEREKINTYLDKMETELLQEVDSTFQIKLQNLESIIKEVDLKIASLQDNLQKINVAKDENASEKYVQIKYAAEKKKIAQEYLDNKHASEKEVRLRFDPYMKVIDYKLNIIGKVIYRQNIEVESCDEFNVRSDADNRTCNITDICICEDGSIVLTDCKNKRIKKMDNSFIVISSLDVDAIPYGICKIGSSLLAVTLINERKVQFICQKEPMNLEHCFEVGDRCRGIVYNDGLIYVCCGGFRERKEGTGHLEIYTISGKLVASYYGEIQCPVYVTVSSQTEKIFVNDWYNDIHIIDIPRFMKRIQVNNKIFHENTGICWIKQNQICAAFLKSNNILLMSHDGEDQEEFLSNKDGITGPRGLYFHDKISKLIVPSDESDKLMVYSLKLCK